MLSGLWGGSASSSKYTPLSDVEGSTVPPRYGMPLLLFRSDYHVNCLLRRTDGDPAKIPLLLFPLDTFMYTRAMPLSKYLVSFGSVRAAGCLSPILTMSYTTSALLLNP